MTVEVQAPDGSTISFPDNVDAATIHSVMSQHFGNPQTANARVANDFAELPLQPGDLRPTREVPPPGAPGGNYTSDITQRARNTAFGQGPGSMGIPGVAALAPPGLGAVAKGFRALPPGWQTFIASSGALAASEAAKHLGAPESVTKFLEDAGLVRMFGKH